MSDQHLRPPRPELLALLDAVKDHPDEDTPRLILADWLDEQDDPLDAERAAFIRAGVERSRGSQVGHTEAEYTGADDLLRRWLGPAAELGYRSFVRGMPVFYPFARGLPVIRALGPRLLKPDAPALLATEAFAFVQFVHLEEAGGRRMEALAALPEFRFVPGVSLHPFSSFGTASAARFFGSPNLTGLRQIEFRSVKPGVAGVQALADNPALARLRKLSLAHNTLVDKAAAALAGANHLASLTHLDLADNNIGDAGAEALAASSAFPNLRELDLRENPRLTEKGKQCLRDAFGDRVRLTGTLF